MSRCFLGVLSLLAIVLGVFIASDFAPSLAMFRSRDTSQTARGCLILGATGATGKHVLAEVLRREQWSKVVVIGRSAPSMEQNDQHAKLTTVVVEDVGAVTKEQLEGKLQGVDTFFNCIGTTRAQAGSAEKFYEIEVGISNTVAKIAKEAGVKHGSVISAQGASPERSIAPTWFHPLYYGKVIGMKEKAMIDAGFQRITIFRPGMLQRHDTSRASERIFANILPSLDVKILAAAMVNDAESTPVEGPEKPLYISGNGLITKLGRGE